MFRFIRSIARRVVEKIRSIEMILFNRYVQRRGTIHSICRGGTLNPEFDAINAKRRGTIHSICEVSLCAQ